MSRYVPVNLRRQIRTHFSDRCAYCRTAEALTITTFEIEHIHPLATGGTTSFENLALACPMCNRCKSDRKQAIDPATGKKVPLFHPQREVWNDHFTWNDDATAIVPLTSMGRATVTALRMNRPQLIRMRQMWVKMDEHPPP